MLKVSRYLLRYPPNSQDIVDRFELQNSRESSSSLSLRTYYLQCLIHCFVLAMIFLNMSALSMNYQVLALIVKAVHCSVTIVLVLMLPKVANNVSLMKSVMHGYNIFGHATSIALALLYDRYNAHDLATIIFLEHFSIINLQANSSVLHFNTII